MADSVIEAVDVLGVGVTPFRSYDDAVACIRGRMSGHLQTFCVAINPEKVYRAMHDPALKSVLDSADVKICDGVGIALAARILHRTRLRRCTGIDLFHRLIAQAAREGWRVFLLGGSSEANQCASANLQHVFPDLRIAGRHNGYVSNSNRVVEQINSSGAELLFVGMGSPRQEFWVSDHRKDLNVRLCMGIGGTLDVVAGLVPRAPAIFRRTGTEFAYRLAMTPSRWRRQACLPIFMMHVLKQRLAASWAHF